jgi:hypothetical protein
MSGLVRLGVLRTLAIASLAIALLAGSVPGGDCDGNGRDDDADIAAGLVPDCDLDGIPDGCLVPAISFSPYVIFSGGDTGDLAAMDFDGDGHADLAFISNGYLGIRFGDGRGSLAARPDVGLVDLGRKPGLMAAADFTGDGILDLAVGASGNVQAGVVLRGRGDGTFEAPGPIGEGVILNRLVAADLDGDGRTDLAGISIDGTRILVLAGNGDGAFGPPAAFPTGEKPSAMAAADFDGDGEIDLAVADTDSSEVQVLIGDGAGGFREEGSLHAADGPVDLVAGDAGGDGLQDLLAANSRSATVSLLAGRPGGGFEPERSFPAGLSPSRLLLSDLDGAGNPDLFVTDSRLMQASVLPGLRLGGFGRPIGFPVSSGIPVPADFDEDGRVDIALSVGGSSDLIVLLLNRTESVPPADCNGNGIPDGCEAGDGVPDGCGRLPDPVRDCNGNGTGDDLDIASGSSPDCDGNGVPDECEIGPRLLDIPGGDVLDLEKSASAAAIGDIDGDGAPDVAAALREADAVALFLSTGRRSFSPAGSLPAGNGPSAIAAVDLDGDGIDDLAAVNSIARSLSVFLGKREGPQALPAAPANGALQVLAADFDRDGHIDLALPEGETGSYPALILPGRGDGGFLASIPTERYPSPASAAAADLDADGAIDLALLSKFITARWIAILSGRGDGTFEETRRIAAPVMTTLDAGDIDGDGVQDLALSSSSVQTGGCVLRGRGSFAIGPRLAAFARLAVFDLDGDGLRDIVGFRSSLIEVQYNGGGTFGPPLLLAPAESPSATAVGDLDGDGLADIVALNTKASILWGERPRGYRAAVSPDLSMGARLPAAQMEIGDLDGDPFPDLIVPATDEGRLVLLPYRGRGDGTFLPGVAPEVGRSGYEWVPGDFDGDGRLDLLTGIDRLYLGTGSGTFAEGPPAEFRWKSSQFLFDRRAADLDGDGRLDLLFAYREGIDVHLDIGGLRFVQTETSYMTRSGELKGMVVADFDGDGAQDLAAAGSAAGKEVLVALNRGPAIFGPPSRYPLGEPGATEGTNPSSLAAGDLDGDGSLDLIAANVKTQDVAVLRGDGTGSFLAPARTAAGAQAKSVAAGDLDGDGRDDVAAVVGESKGSLVVFTSTPEGNLRAPVTLMPAVGLGLLRLADVDADGVEDIFVLGRSSDPREFFLFRNASIPGARDCDANGVPDSCQIAGGSSPDVDADGVPDGCQPDCDGNSVPDAFDISRGSIPDCNRNGAPDSCDIGTGASRDVDGDGVPDECQADCDGNGVPDPAEVAAGTAPDCNGNSIPDACDIATKTSKDADKDGVPDECQPDCNRNGVPDAHDLATKTSADCDLNSIPDECDIAGDLDLDLDRDGVLDACQDCNENDLPDTLEIALGLVPDCDGNGIPDRCDIAGGASDCDRNGVPDSCDLAGGAPDSDGSGILDACEGGRQVPGDCDQDGNLSLSDAICLLGALFLGDPDRLPCGSGSTADPPNRALLDWDGGGRVDITDAVAMLGFAFLGMSPHHLAPLADEGQGCILIFDCPEQDSCP